MIKQLALIKMRSNLFTGGLNQLVLADMIYRGPLEQHLQALRRHHHMLCDAALEAIAPSIRHGLLRCRVPSGSLYLWCKLLFPVDPDNLFAALEAKGVSVAPGAAFEPERGGKASPYFRLCFTAVCRDLLLEGIHILNRTVEDFRAKGLPSEPLTAAIQ